jgi:hypothetical protein
MRGPRESRLFVAVGLVAAGIGAACAEEVGTRGVYIIEAPQSPADNTVAATPPASPAAPQSTPPAAAAAPRLDPELPTALAPPRPAPTPAATASAPLLQPTPPLAGPGSQPHFLLPTTAAPRLDTELPAALAPARPAPTPSASAPPPQPGFALSGHSEELAAPGARPDASLATPAPLKLNVENAAELSLELVPGPEVTVGTKMAFRVRAKKSGYLVLVDIDPTGKLTQIYPNPQALAGQNRAKSNFIKAGRTVVIPDLMSGMEYVATPPVGAATIVAVLSDRPVQMLDLAEIPSFIADQAGEVAYLSRMTSELRILSEGAPQQARWSFDAKAYAIRGLP